MSEGGQRRMATSSRSEPSRLDLEQALQELANRARARERLPSRPLKLQDRRTRHLSIYREIERNQVAGRAASRAEEWLLDNRHIIEEALAGLRDNVPAGYVRSLPHVRNERGKSQPVVEVLARLLLDHGGEPVELGWIERTVERYQDHFPLTIGELWALPAFLTLAVIDDLLIEGQHLFPDTAGAARGRGGESLEVESVDAVAGGILSLRALSAHGWRDTFEALSRVDRILGEDPAGAYAAMDFLTRDRYRQQVEQLARRSPLQETEIARRVVALSTGASANKSRHQHVGYWLIGGGRDRLTQAIDFRPGLRQRLLDFARRRPSPVYFSLLAGFAAVPLLALAIFLVVNQASSALVVTMLLLTAVPLTGLAVALANGLVTWLIPPRSLARMDFERNGIPGEFRTAVVVPVIFGRPEDVDPIFERLEINFLANDDPSLAFVVLGDLHDADQPRLDTDERILKRCRRCVRRLERHYGKRFVFMARKRLWNPSEGCWMGWERKRGKLMEFNRILAGDDATSYDVAYGEPELLEDIRYVITLDADTRLPPGSARQLVGTLAHPLSQAVLDRRSGMLKAGYGIIQPRLEVDPDSTLATRFTRVFAGDTTMDLYTHASSDVYHDLFGEGIFTGKGIYDWRAVEHTLGGRIPENTLLSHDLLEGVHARVGLASDIVLMEQFPSSVVAYMRRQHRWVRGDWQLLPWLRRKVRVSDGSRQANPLHLVHYWKIIDNLRRSLQPPVILALLLIGLSGLLPGVTWIWILLFALLMGPGLITELLDGFGRGVASPRSAWPRLRRLPRRFLGQVQLWLLNLVLLPYQSAILLDAVGRAIVRMSLTRRHLLEWTTAVHTQRSLGSARRHLWREMWMAPALGMITALVLALTEPAMLPFAAPLLLGWLLAPQIAAVIDRMPVREMPSLDPTGADLLRRVGRRTWLFFERFVGPDTHWLPPDNFQIEPRVLLAERTSPTNIGLALQSALCAHDMGWFDGLSMAAWLRNSMDGMAQLERYRGHWLNWYELRGLNRLEPAYVSTVDSGNLAVCLVTLARGLEDIVEAPLDPLRLLNGLSDTLGVIAETVEALPGVVPAHERSRHLLATLKRQRQELADTPRSRVCERLGQWRGERFDELADEVIGLAEDSELVVSAEAIAELRVWLDELHAQVRRAGHFIDELLPWLKDFEALEEVLGSSEATEPGMETRLAAMLAGNWRLSTWGARYKRARKLLEEIQRSKVETSETGEARAAALEQLSRQLEYAHEAALRMRQDLVEIAQRSDLWAREMDFRFLYDGERHLFRIGHDVSNASPDPNFYDLLASEARLASLFAIATGQVPTRHWLHLGRPFRRREGRGILMSWGATLFEYMMPRLFTHTPAGTLLDSASRSAIALHRAFADTHQLPWGISESAYYQLDEQQVYAYRAFGVPGLGFKRDLGERMVVAPYASIMALPFEPSAVVDNLRRIKSLRGLGLYGYYEALDFGRRGSESGRRARIVKAWMSHHQGMALVAITNALCDDIMVHRFHSDPHIAGVSMLLHERLPRVLPDLPVPAGSEKARMPKVAPDPMAWQVEPRSASPSHAVLSNGHYSVIINGAGGGGSTWQGLQIHRWQADATTNSQGHWVLVRDLDSGEQFSISLDPGPDGAERRDVTLGAHFAEFRCHRHELFCRMRMGVAAQHDIEARKLLISNESSRPRRLLIASYAELAMAPPEAFERHPAFARLFIESECLADEHTLLFRRRPRSSEEGPVYVANCLVPPAGQDIRFGWDTDRQSFLGRDGDYSKPAGLAHGSASMAGRSGAIIDPAMALAVECILEPYGRLETGLLTGAGRSRREVLGALRSYRSLGRIDWLFEQARMQTSLELHHLRMQPDDARGAMALASAVLTPHRNWRRVDARPEEPLQSLLWSRGISGDWPIIVMEVSGESATRQIEEVLVAHTFLAGRRLRSDLVLLDLTAGGYEQTSRDRLQELSESIRSRIQRVLSGQVIVIPARELSAEQFQGIISAASVVLEAERGSLLQQLQVGWNPVLPPLVPTRPDVVERNDDSSANDAPELQFDNGYGGFSTAGHEYIIHEREGRTPAPWSNVLANPDFGCLVTESGTSFTWAGNSSEHRLTPWPNDPVLDVPGDVVYLRDEETGAFWSPTPGPRPGQGPYRIHHGTGYTSFIHQGHGLAHEFRIHVDREQPVGICVLRLTNQRDWTRRLTVTRFVEWVLGNRRGDTALHLDCGISVARQVMLVRNRFDRFSGNGHGFLASNLPMHGFTTDRTEFLGPGGHVRDPAAMRRIGLSGRIEPGTDPCAALQVHLDLPPGQTMSVVFVLGHAGSRERALELAAEFADEGAAEESYRRVLSGWEDRLGKLQVSTPEPSIDLLLNRWLPYQAISARLEGRTGYYQSSGGFGFRDQLQDAMAMTWLSPEVTREQIMRAASRQFAEGDVLHWWHEAPLRGVRTRCSDDLLWLPLVTAHYVRSTGDTAVLDESVPYIEGQPLSAEEAERYAEYGQSQRQGSLYEHCCRALDRASVVGSHGLPIIGSGDWNDGFNRVSTTGRGESAWMGWFLVRVLGDFAQCCELQNDSDTAGQYRKLAEQLVERMEEHAWDGQWYRRAWYDDGTPLGSSSNKECRIDLIAQAWSVLGPSRPARHATQAMRSALSELVDHEHRLILLLDPPFDKTPRDPGYIKGYPPGIRENGAQYTHAATWAVWASAGLGWRKEAAELFRLLDPIQRASTPAAARRYRLEPYVLAGDIYSQGSNRGRGGWSWYTGAAAWLYRAGVEALFGLKLEGRELLIEPCLPPEWTTCSLKASIHGTELHLDYRQERGDAEASGITVVEDHQELPSNRIRLDQATTRRHLTVRIVTSE
jgi:cyclic beta-1,2-glucan synthetase